jgi:adenosylhomocysteine nucleosidase
MELIGIIGAMEEEVLTLKEKMDVREVRSIASLDFFIGNINRKKCVVVQSGIGKVNAAVCTQILIDIFYVDAIINTGVAGALSPKLEIGDIVISKDAVQHDFDTTSFGYEVGIIPRMKESYFKSDEHLVKIAMKASDILNARTNVFLERIVSGDQFIADPVRKEEIVRQFNGFCTEMEGAAIAQVCYLNNVPSLIIRSISDKADASAEMNFAEFSRLAAINSSHLIERMLELM